MRFRRQRGRSLHPFHFWHKRWLAMVCALVMSAFLFRFAMPTPADAQDGYIRSPRLGITFVNTGSQPNANERYRNALLLGTGWTRYPFYWNSLETSPGGYNWSAYDQQVINDLRAGLQINAILMGIPGFYANGGSIQNLYAPIFSDGTDVGGVGKPINAGNYWASFVAQTVNRYRPGGTLANANRLTGGVRIWEAWNEPDLGMFWTGGVQDYARILKITYLAVKSVDPNAQVMFAGLAYNNPDVQNYLDQTLAVIARDPAAGAYNWYFDIAAVHAYSSARRSEIMVGRIRDTLARYGLSRPIWLNESGVPVWDDYPGPTWTASNPADRLYRGTMTQQAAYAIQSTALAWAAGADVVFWHQLYDDCGNQPGGTDFAPNSGRAGDAFGLFRNVRGMSCFSQHPQPGSPRPAATAFHLLAQIFGASTYTNAQIVNLDRRATLISFDRTPPVGGVVDQRIYVLWNRTGNWLNLVVPASGNAAALFTMDNQDFVLTPTDGAYTIGLQPAAPPGYPSLGADDLAQIGAPPYIMVENVMSGQPLGDPRAAHFEGEPPPSQPTDSADVGGAGSQVNLATLPPPPTDTVPESTPSPTIRPTLDPALDGTPPIPFVNPLPPTSTSPIAVSWGAGDESGIAQYIVWVRIDGGDWQVWLETTNTSGLYAGETGRTYEFALWAVDLAGNWTGNIELQPMAITRVG